MFFWSALAPKNRPKGLSNQGERMKEGRLQSPVHLDLKTRNHKPLLTSDGHFVYPVDGMYRTPLYRPLRPSDPRNNTQVSIRKIAARERPRGAASQRAERIGAFVENIDMTTLLERDGWKCGICDKGIDPKLRHPNRMAGTLDHVIPLNQGGQHHYGNAQAAHYACNSSKGDRFTAKELARYRAINGGF